VQLRRRAPADATIVCGEQRTKSRSLEREDGFAVITTMTAECNGATHATLKGRTAGVYYTICGNEYEKGGRRRAWSDRYARQQWPGEAAGLTEGSSIINIIIVIRPCLHALAPQPARDAAQVALHDADHVRALNAGATVVVDNRGQAKQQGRQRAAAAQQLQPLLAQVNLVLQ